MSFDPIRLEYILNDGSRLPLEDALHLRGLSREQAGRVLSARKAYVGALASVLTKPGYVHAARPVATNQGGPLNHVQRWFTNAPDEPMAWRDVSFRRYNAQPDVHPLAE